MSILGCQNVVLDLCDCSIVFYFQLYMYRGDILKAIGGLTKIEG